VKYSHEELDHKNGAGHHHNVIGIGLKNIFKLITIGF